MRGQFNLAATHNKFNLAATHNKSTLNTKTVCDKDRSKYETKTKAKCKDHDKESVKLAVNLRHLGFVCIE